MATIPLYKHLGPPSGRNGSEIEVGKTEVDDEDLQRTSQHRWRLSAQGYAYRYVTVKGERSLCVLLHRWLLNAPPKLQIDHINMNRLDNRRANLRLVTYAENKQNVLSYVKPGRTSRFRGVSWSKQAKKWVAQTRLNNVGYYLGNYSDEAEAARVAADWRKAHMPYSQD